MANHKRKRPKNRRAGCLMCKPQKMNGAGRKFENRSEKRARGKEADSLKEAIQKAVDACNTTPRRTVLKVNGDHFWLEYE